MNRIITVMFLTAGMVLTGCSSGGAGSPAAGDIEDVPMVYTPSGLPAPAQSGIPAPAGAAENLQVLDWAGFAGAVSYTFDDGQPSHVAHYDELNDTGARMTFYFVSNMVAAGAVTTFTQAVADGHEIGNHTVSHPQVDAHGNLSGPSWPDSAASPEEEMDSCTAYITGTFGQSDVWTMASPFGDSNWEAYAANRFLLNRRVGGGTVSPMDTTNPHSLSCYMALSSDDASTYTDFIDEARAGNAWRIFCFHSILPTSDTWYEPVDIHDITYSIRYAKYQGDTWVDSLIQVGAYWIAQKMFAGLTPEVTGDTSTWTWTLPDHFPPGKYLRVTVDGGTLSQNGTDLVWDDHGFYEVALDAGELTLAP